MTPVIESIELGPTWLEELLSIISLKDEVARIKKDKANAQEKLRRMTKAYTDGLFPDEEYHHQKKLIEMEIESLIVPEADVAEEAGKLIKNLPELWRNARLAERHKLLMTMLNGVYVDAKIGKKIMAIKPKPPFRPIFQVAVKKEGSDISIINEPSRYKVENPPVFLVETGEG